MKINHDLIKPTKIEAHSYLSSSLHTYDFLVQYTELHVGHDS